jgi:hypothetical protein
MKKSISLTIALSISLFIYVFYRSEKTVVNEIMILLLSSDLYTSIKNNIVSSIPLNKQVIFSLPGGLWIFCVTALSQNFFMRVASCKMPVIYMSIIFAVGLEFCQLVHFTNGRFDVWDIGFYLLFWFLAYYSFEPRESQQQNIVSPFTLHGFICLACFLSVYLAHVSR